MEAPKLASPGRDPTRSLLLIDDGAAANDQTAYTALVASLEQQLELTVRLCIPGDAQRSVRRQLTRVVDSGSIYVVLLPLFRGSARQHLVQLDSLTRWAREHWPGLQCVRAAELWSNEHLLGLLDGRAEQAIAGAAPLSQHATALLIAAPGGDVDDNADWSGLARRLWERRGSGLVELAFMSQAQPDLAAGIERAARLGARRIVVLPTELLDGPGWATVAAQVRAVVRPDVELLIAEPLGRTGSVAAVAAQRYREALRAGADGAVSAASAAHAHGHGAASAPRTSLLPPRYRDGAPVSAAPMASAGLKFDAHGRVAWDRIWGEFCDLALAGGPPHRATLLEPVAPDEILADPDGYSRVLDELERGLRLVTGLDVVSRAPGWIGLCCDDDEMARWLLRAIVVENVAVRREGTVLLLPAGPAFRLENEIRNVVTVVAKTFHYWCEHRAA